MPDPTRKGESPIRPGGLARADLGQLAAAIADYAKAIELDPDDAHAYYNRGLARAYQDQLTDAFAGPCF